MMNTLDEFYKEYWAVFDCKISNQTAGRNHWRVNDLEISLHPQWGKRWETQANGLMLINIDEPDLTALRDIHLYMELWGGHPHTGKKQVTLNGKGTYTLPDSGTEAGHCIYTYPHIPLTLHHLVSGMNALQFSCQRGESFWGHYIVDNAAFQCHYQPEHPALKDWGDFAPRIIVDPQENCLSLSLEGIAPHLSEIARVTYLGRYFDFDDRGSLQHIDWHGFTLGRQWQNHIGTAHETPFDLVWDTQMIPDQPQPMTLCAIIDFQNGLKYKTFLENVSLPVRDYHVYLFQPDVPAPFWSRDNQLREATLQLDTKNIIAAELLIKIWDGGEGMITDPFKINHYPYPITSGKAIHDVVFTRTTVALDHLRYGENCFELLSDTEHHGIEVLLPGPCIKVKASD